MSREDSGQSQTIKAILGLRGMIIEGHLKPGERVLEQVLVDELGVSRTPARTAIIRVCEEGLIEMLPSGGYAVATFSEADVFDAIAIRGNLEGMAARLAAERGVPIATMVRLERCVQELDKVVEELAATGDVTDYVKYNDLFHELLLEAAQSSMLKKSLLRITALPFAAPNSFVKMSYGGPSETLRILQISQEQHRSILDAIKNRESARAEALTQEHSRSAWKFLKAVFEKEAQPNYSALQWIAQHPS